jgi:hypothetical protein
MSRPQVADGAAGLLTSWPLYKDCTCIQGVSRLQGIIAGGDFIGLCDQKSSYKHVSDFGQLRNYDRFFIPVHALVRTASSILDAADHIRNSRATRAVHNGAAACVAAGGGIFENQL